MPFDFPHDIISTSPTWRSNAMNRFAILEDPMRAASEICP